ncbi:MAG TPA: energy transducer TonB [Rhodothermales bacterium]|nr:energy transducer TonB [Rhodothermales bacterium]
MNTRTREHATAPARDLRDGYRLRLLGGCIVALLLLIAVAHFPTPIPRSGIDWHTQNSRRHLTRQEIITLTDAQTAGIQTPAGAFSESATDGQGGNDAQTFDLQAAGDSERVGQSRAAIPHLNRLEGDFADVAPQVVGGLGAFYINIQYPEKARLAGIEGQLVLSFVVEANGVPSEIHVDDGLHPLCDSAAVRALRATRFVPVRQNGKYVRIRMRLPVRFKLIDNPAAPSGNG